MVCGETAQLSFATQRTARLTKRFDQFACGLFGVCVATSSAFLMGRSEGFFVVVSAMLIVALVGLSSLGIA